MRGSVIIKLIGFVVVGLFGSFSAAGQEPTQDYFIKPSDVIIPKDAQWGQIRRTIQPFENWTLICDENLKKKEKVCNISQIIVDHLGNQIFSWSLAATQSGEPFMLLRVPARADRKKALAIFFPGRETAVNLANKGCDEKVCLALMPVGPLTRENIDKGSDVTVSFALASGEPVRITVPLNGIATAFKAVR